jgi:hypothetical protein
MCDCLRRTGHITVDVPAVTLRFKASLVRSNSAAVSTTTTTQVTDTHTMLRGGLQRVQSRETHRDPQHAPSEGIPVLLTGSGCAKVLMVVGKRTRVRCRGGPEHGDGERIRKVRPTEYLVHAHVRPSE